MPAPPFLQPSRALGPVRLLTVLCGVLVLLVLSARLAVEWHWFAQFGFQGVLLKRWLLQIGAFALVCGPLSLLQLQQLQRCWRLRQESERKQVPAEALLTLKPSQLVLTLLALLLLLAMGLSYVLVQARALIEAPFSGNVISGFSLLQDLPPLLPLGLAASLVLPLLLAPLTTLRITLAAALAGSATALARGWSLWLPALLAVPFAEADPLTGLDLSVSVLRMPALRLLVSVLFAQGLVGLSACLLITVSEGNSLSELRFVGLSRGQQRVLQPQLAVLAIVAAVSSALAPFDLMVDGSGVAAGAGFVDLHVRLPLRLLLSALLLLTALGLLVPLPRGWLRRGALIPLTITTVMVPLSEGLLAPLVQRLWVQPRELAVETPYLQRSIKATRRAFGLEGVREVVLEPGQRLSPGDLKAAPGTLDNIRLWDSQPLLAANRQLQQLRLYYRFSSAAVDRYPLQGRSSRDDVTQQVLIAARELDSSALPPESRTWLNKHLVFTNGHGFTVSPVNVAGPDGLPLYFVKDLGRSGRARGIPQLGVEDSSAEQVLPVGRPSLYYASAPAPYAIAPTQVREFAYPEGE
ncbi:MAG: UPF0182 family protein, partial [Cyanobium sp.]